MGGVPLNSFPSLEFACVKGTAKYPTLKCDEVYSSLMWQTYCFSLRPKLSHKAVGFMFGISQWLKFGFESRFWRRIIP